MTASNLVQDASYAYMIQQSVTTPCQLSFHCLPDGMRNMAADMHLELHHRETCCTCTVVHPSFSFMHSIHLYKLTISCTYKKLDSQECQESMFGRLFHAGAVAQKGRV